MRSDWSTPAWLLAFGLGCGLVGYLVGWQACHEAINWRWMESLNEKEHQE